MAAVWINAPGQAGDQEAGRDPHGLGQGLTEWWVAVVKPGRVMFELVGVLEATAQEAMRLAAHKLPMKCKFVKRADAE